MIKILLKHTILELCIDQFFGAMLKNFMKPAELLISKQVFSRVVCADRSNGIITGWILYNAYGVRGSIVNGVQYIEFKSELMRTTVINTKTGKIISENSTRNATKWITKEMLVDIDL